MMPMNAMSCYLCRLVIWSQQLHHFAKYGIELIVKDIDADDAAMP